MRGARDGTGAPGIFADILTDCVDDWLVVEWRLNVFGTNSLGVFQTWIGLNGTEDITFAYDPANLPAGRRVNRSTWARRTPTAPPATRPGLPTEDRLLL